MKQKKLFIIVTAVIFMAVSTIYCEGLSYVIVDTGQTGFYSNNSPISCPKAGQEFYGQDAQYEGNPPQYKSNGDGTVTDLNTGLMWQKATEGEKYSFNDALKVAQYVRVGGYDDWRLPTIKELYSLIDFTGYSMRTVSESVPYIDTNYFDFEFGDESKGERLIDAQYWSATEYVGTTMGGNATVFGVNFADGRIKGYPKYDRRRNSDKKMYVRYVRGNSDYGINKFSDNSNGTVTDKATGLTWMKVDSGKTMNWKEALSYAENLNYAGSSDWRLPSAKELQSIIDYTASPALEGENGRAAINPVFDISDDESYFWTGTTHLEHGRCSQGVYIAFGRAMGYMSDRSSGGKTFMDVHGAGAQRSDPKSGNAADYPTGRGPQGDDIRINNYVRCVRGGAAEVITTAPAPEKLPASSMSGPQGNNAGAMPGGGSGQDFVSRLDKDGDSKVSKSEFDGPSEHFSNFDRNGDGYIESSEAPTGPPPGMNSQEQQGQGNRMGGNSGNSDNERGRPQGNNQMGPGNGQQRGGQQGDGPSRNQDQGGRQQKGGQQDFIERLDKDGDGKVSKDEFDGPSDHFSDFDKDGDGYIEDSEKPTGPPPGGQNQGRRR